jgi:hypothetical protein
VPGLDSVIETFTDEDQRLARYVLSELGESVSIDLENEMLLDDELYERMQVVEMNLIDGYVRDEMLPEERRRFEESFLVVPENGEKVNRARMFHESVRLLHREGKMSPAPARGWRPQIAKLFHRPLLAGALVVAAVLFIIAVIVVMVARQHPAENANTVAVDSTPTAPANTRPVSGTTPDDSTANSTPTPQPPTAPGMSANQRPDQVELARNNGAQHIQQEYISRQGGSGVERSGGEIVHITIRKQITHLRLIYELLDDVPAKETYGVTIKNRYDEPIWPQNDVNKIEVRPVLKDGLKRKRLIIVNVPANIFKDGGPYLFEFDDSYIPAKNFTIKR